MEDLRLNSTELQMIVNNEFYQFLARYKNKALEMYQKASEASSASTRRVGWLKSFLKKNGIK